MRSPRILSTSIAAALVLVPAIGRSAQSSITAGTTATAWATAGNWTPAAVPTIADNVLMVGSGSINSSGTSTNIQDLTFNGTGAIVLKNDDAAANMTLTLNGRGTFIPLIETKNTNTSTIQAGTSGRTITIQLAQGGEFKVANGGTLNILGAISQDATSRYVEKTGLGTLVLGGANTFTGGLFISGGKVTMNASATLVAASAVTVFSTGTYEVNSTTAPNLNTISVNSGGTFILGGTGLLGANSVLNLTGGASGNALGRIESNTGSQFTTNVNNGGILRVSGTIGAGSTTTVVSGGTITGNGTINGATNIGTGGRIETGLNGVGNLTFSNLTLGTAAGHTSTIQATPGSAIIVTANNGFTVNGGANSVSFVLPAVTATGTFALIDYAGTLGGTGFAAFNPVLQLPNRVVANLVNNTVNTRVDLNVTSFDFPIWSGALDGEWRVATQASPKNWVLNSNNATGTDFQTLDIVKFTDAATNTAVSLNNGDVTPASVDFSNVTKEYTIDGTSAIAGTGPLTKSGAGRTVINTINSFTGSVTINGGTLAAASLTNAGAAGALGAGSSAIAINAATLEYTGFGGDATNRPIALTGNATIKTTEFADVTLSGSISGSGNLTKTGPGTLIISGENSYGNTTISEGTLQVGDIVSVGTFGTGSSVSVAVGAEVVFDLPANATVTQTISGGGILRKRGSGALTLSGGTANTYTGVTNIDSGTLIAAKTAGDAIPGALIINGGGTFLMGANNQLAAGTVVTINGGSFGDLGDGVQNTIADTFSRVNLNDGNFTTGRTLNGFTLTDRFQITGGAALMHRGGVMTSNRVDVTSPGLLRLDGGSTTAGQESKLTINAGGFFLSGATVTYNTGNGGNSVVTSGSVGSIIALNGNLTSTGISNIANVGVAGPKAQLNLGAAIRTFNVEGSLTVGSTDGPVSILNGGITKTGTGVLTIPGPQAYALATAIQGGELAINGALSTTSVNVGFGTIFSGTGTVAGGNVKVENGGTIDVGLEGLGALTFQSMTLGTTTGNQSTLLLTRNSTPAIINVTNSNGLVANGGASSVTLNVSGTAPGVGQHVLIDYAGVIGGSGFGAFTLGALPNRVNATLVNDTVNTQIKLNVTLSDLPLWSGSLGTNWVTGLQAEPKNWVLNSNGTTTTDFVESDVALFNDSATSTNVDINSGYVRPAAVRFENVTKTFTFNGADGIGNSPTVITGLVKNGAGTVELYTPNTFTGTVTINAGKIRVAAMNDIGQPSGVGAGKTIALNGGTLEIDSIGVTSDKLITISAAGGTISVPNDGEVTLDGTISGPGKLTKDGTGGLLLKGVNSAYNSGIIIKGGRLQFFTTAGLGAATQQVTLNGGTLEYTNPDLLQFGGTVIVSPITGGGISVVNGAPDDTGGMWFSTANSISGSGPLTKYGGATLRMNAVNNTLTSPWFVNEGTLEAVVAGSLGSGSVTCIGGVLVPKNITFANPIFMNGGAIGTRDGDSTNYSGAFSVQGPSFVNLYNNIAFATQLSITISGLMSGSGTLSAVVDSTTANSGKTLTISNAGNTFNGMFDITRNQILLAQSTTAAGSTLGSAAIQLNASTLRIRNNGTGSNGTLAYGNNIIIQPLPGAVSTSTIEVDRASGANTGNTVRLGGLTVNAETAFATTVALTAGNSYGAQFDGSSTLNGTISLSSTTTNFQFNGPVSGTGNVSLLNSGRTLTLTNTGSTFSGRYLIPSGSIIASIPATTGDALGSAAVTLTAATARLRDNGTGNNQVLPFGNAFTLGAGASTFEVNRVSGANTGNTIALGALTIGSSTLNVTTTSSYKLAFDGPTTLTANATFTPTADLELNGAISGSFGITKSGTGRLALNSSSNTFSGAVTVTAGTLGGVGTIPSSVSVTNAAGIIAPGNGPGILTIQQNVTFVAGADFSVELARGTSLQPIPGEYDQLRINTGTITLANADLVLAPLGGLQLTDIFFIMINNGANAVSGTFAGKPDDSFFTANGYTLQISYDANFATGSMSGGNDIAIMVPEPTGAALMLGGLATLLSRRRRKA